MTAKKVWSEVLKGFRLAQPPECPSEIYFIMQCCWADYGVRPVFTQLIDMLKEYDVSGEKHSIADTDFSGDSDDIPNITIEAPIEVVDSGNILPLTPEAPRPESIRKVPKAETVV